jgi:prevent-host-death family protein
MTIEHAERSTWQAQDAKQCFMEVLERANVEGPQVVSEHGREVAVILAMEEYRRLTSQEPDFKEFLLSAPDLSVLDLQRDKSTETREIDVEGIE